MKLLALDPSLHTGWAMYDNGAVTSGVWHLDPPKAKKMDAHRKNGMRVWCLTGHMLEAFYVWKTKTNALYFEEVASHGKSGVYAAHLWGAWYGVITLQCYRHNIPCIGVPVKTIKAHAGHGDYDKQDMIAAARIRWGVEPKDDNEADALMLLSYAVQDWKFRQATTTTKG